MYRLHDGYQKCPRCQGQGCYWCRRSGYMSQCPRCMNSEPELLHRDDDDVVCDACGTKFDHAGSVILPENEKLSQDSTKVLR